jgi:hydrogenase maturation protein HypF
MTSRVKIFVRGIVQGVGFRPFVYSLAKSLNLKGYVLNSSKGVTIEIEGDNSKSFVERLTSDAPPLSQIMDIEVVPMPYRGYEDFRILKSEDEGSFTLISPDVSICQDCFRELLDGNDRRYLYPFINCTNCGPRYTITKSVPYDRPNTTMSVFQLCPDCEREYQNPEDRRFHAQPNACPVCGPHVQLKVKNEKLNVDEKENAIRETIRLLKEGYIVAIKGLGGFHLACDASNEEAVNSLRLRKRKSNKPFALMSPDVKTVRKFCNVSREEENLLVSIKRPIVLLTRKEPLLPEAVSPKNPCIGFMLPYTPLHYLLFYYPLNEDSTMNTKRSLSSNNPPPPPFSKGGTGGFENWGNVGITANFDALVMTSGNIAEEPIVIHNEEAVAKLSGIADAFLLHNRDIFMRVDDSVVIVMEEKETETRRNGDAEKSNISDSPSRRVAGSISFIRRSRGYVPDPIHLHEEGPDVLGCGADIKNSFTLIKGSFAIPSQHIGDMENYETLQFFEESLRNLKDVYRVKPVALAYDLHPMYLSTRWALRQEGIEKIGIQHHHAHVASVMAEKGIKKKVVGVSFDGTGYGTDGNLWGGEFLLADIQGFKRSGHFKYVPLPGGEVAVKEPWRITVSIIKDMAGDETMPYLKSLGFIEKYGDKKIRDILKIIDNRQFSPLSSGAGRLFDGVSALMGVCDRNTFEGEAAIALEAIAVPGIVDDYPVDIKLQDPLEIDLSQTVLKIMEDLGKGVSKNIISSKFHNTMVTVILRVVLRLSEVHSVRDVVLCGGVFQNLYLLKKAMSGLASMGMTVHIHDKVPTNDAGISLGQAYIIRERIKEAA